MKLIIQTTQAFVKNFNGKEVTRDKTEGIGASGETKLYSLNAGVGIYLRDDEVKQVA